MSTVSIHIEGHEDGSLDDAWDLAAALRHIAEALGSGDDPGLLDIPIPMDVVQPYVSPFDDEREPARWSVQYGVY